MNSKRCALLVLALTSSIVTDALAAQRGGRARAPESVRERWGNYFTLVNLTSPDSQQEIKDPKAALESCAHVKNAAAAEQLSLLYLFDSTADAKKREAWEQTMFNHNKIQPGLRLFRCGRVDLSRDRLARDMWGDDAPHFFVFDESGKLAGHASLNGYRGKPLPVVRAMTTASKGYSKVSFGNFVKIYGKFVRDLNDMEAHKKILDGKIQRLEGRTQASHRKQTAKAKKDYAAVEKDIEAHFAMEKKLFERARVPERDPEAQLVGEPKRRGR